jgi:hypothetical protein
MERTRLYPAARALARQLFERLLAADAARVRWLERAADGADRRELAERRCAVLDAEAALLAAAGAGR